MSEIKLTKDQLKAVKHLDGNALVSASAGSGKTKVVISRIIRLITEENVKVNEILAVTFTKLAAEEMKDKLKNALTEKYLATRDKKYKEQLELVSSSDICTIDSFCSKLIKKYFYALGIDANLQVLEESKRKRISETALDEVFENLYDSDDKEFRELIPLFDSSRSDYGLKEAVKLVYNFIEKENDSDGLVKKTEDLYFNAYNYLIDEYKDQIVKLAEKYKQEFLVLEHAFTEDEKRKEYCSKFVALLDFLLTTDDYFEFFYEYKQLNLNLPSTKSKQADLQQSLKEVADPCKKKLATYATIFGIDKKEEDKRLSNSLQIVKALVKIANAYFDRYQKLKAEENAVDFADIERYASILLKNQEILSEVKNTYSYIFVDEYQDVNNVQEEIIVALSKDNAFFVGDSKQSIYAFRGCNPEFFNDKYKSYNQGLGTPISLDDNFRSAKAVVDGVNEIFNKVMTEGYGGTDYQANSMVYGGLYKDYQGVCQIHLVKKAEKKEKEEVKRGVYSVINATEKLEEEDVLSEVKFIVNLIGERLGKTYYDIDNKLKTIELKDICILLRSMDSRNKLSTELVHTLMNMGIPVSSSVEKSISEYPEIKVLLNLVSLLVCAERDVPLASVMLSMGGFDESELASIAKEGAKKYSKTFAESVEITSHKESELGKKCREFLSWLDKKRLIAEFLPSGEVINSIIKETGYLAKVTSSPYGQERVKRIERFLAETTVGGKKLRVIEFESHVNEVLKDLSISSSSGENAINVMTMHASKGLEFPVVIVAGVAKQFNLKNLGYDVIYSKSCGMATRSFDEENMLEYENVARSVIKSRGKRSTAVEELRLFYVALTRAKCELYITMTLDKLNNEFNANEVGGMSDFIVSSVNIPTFYHEDEYELVFPDKRGTAVAGKEVESELTKKIIETLSYKYPYKNEINLPVKSSVSDVNKNQDEYFVRTDKYGESSSEKGTAYHRIFELIDFYNFGGEKEIESFVENGLITKEQAEFIDVDKVESILKLDIFDKIKTSKLLKEQKFCQLVPASELFGGEEDREILVQGICDLIAINGDSATLIDYKISTIESDDDIIKAYKTQMQLYKNAIEKVMKKKVDGVYIINVLKESVIKV
ncbi:MAG: hypothetical protein E7358_00250 [Clostridiales bacterium]|nr:hypothetical protein [Clostridiales bacterium]